MKTPVGLSKPGWATLERAQQEHEAKLAALRTTIDEGDASGTSEGNPFERVHRALQLPRRLTRICL
ncbi:MAG: hypothetical protein ABSA57_10380 [Candidatus Acidiferrales bacterium]|jgi:hypothetical protein